MDQMCNVKCVAPSDKPTENYDVILVPLSEEFDCL